jgi:spermidine synthase
LLVGGEVQSVYPTDADWSHVEQEYWARALALPLARRPRVLFVGLGGATQVHLIRRQRRPRLITVIERDPVVIRIAEEWFGLGQIGGVEFLFADAARAIRLLRTARRRFDFIMDDISYAVPIADATRTATALADLLAGGGRLVQNQHSHTAARVVAMTLRARLPRVWLRRVRREAENILVFAEAPSRLGARRRKHAVHQLPRRRRCSGIMQRSCTTLTPARASRSAASALRMPS